MFTELELFGQLPRHFALHASYTVSRETFRHQNSFRQLATRISAQAPPIGQDAMNLDPLRQFDQELRIALEMVDFGRFALGECRHRFGAAA
ncbi:hypothetical protein [Mesorhizobium sp.]|uniref:hypothetical protein n=1 Tax=Mesorhizobium sp. TaxID=1871066 RepID=UPI0025E71B71|nr:hypothetical protein [Mesorhizobium sp.]